MDLFTWKKPQEPPDCERIAKSPAQILEGHENYILELQEEKEKQETYKIVLWWGLDGLKLKDDGTTEWISRRKVPKILTEFQFSDSSYTDKDVQACKALLAQIEESRSTNETLQRITGLRVYLTNSFASCSMTAPQTQNVIDSLNRSMASVHSNLVSINSALDRYNAMTSYRCAAPRLTAKVER